MNYFELFNKVMLELNYRKITVFANIFKSEHLRILENLNRVNSDICSSENWPFLARSADVTVPADTVAVNNVEGKITKVFKGKKRLAYSPFYESFFNGCNVNNFYSFYDDKLLFPKNPESQTYQVFYNTNKIVRAANGTLKTVMTLENDEPILPQPFAEQLLVYGTCMRTKANPNFPKFAFWTMMFREAYANFRKLNGLSFEDAPYLTLKRRLSAENF